MQISYCDNRNIDSVNQTLIPNQILIRNTNPNSNPCDVILG
jgi:hypothetical protein